MAFRALPPLALAAVTLLSGCSTFRSYDTELQDTNQQLASGNVDGALTLLEKNNTGEDKDLLYYFEKGELLRAKGDLTGSQTAWRRADLVVYTWEESVKFDSASTFPSSAASWSTTKCVATKATTTKKSC